jgi:nitrogen regulatory protein PII
MKQIIALVKPFRAEAVLRAIAELDIEACVVTEAKGYGRQKSYLEQYVGSEYSMAFLPKVEISAWVPDRLVRRATERIVQAARTGRMGDGKIMILPVPMIQGIDI